MEGKTCKVCGKAGLETIDRRHTDSDAHQQAADAILRRLRGPEDKYKAVYLPGTEDLEILLGVLSAQGIIRWNVWEGGYDDGGYVYSIICERKLAEDANIVLSSSFVAYLSMAIRNAINRGESAQTLTLARLKANLLIMAGVGEPNPDLTASSIRKAVADSGIMWGGWSDG